jgi:predicted metal-dependent hydrolase
MTKGLLLVQTTKSVQDGKHTKKLVDKWYRDRIEKVFTDRFDEMKLKFDYKKMPDLAIREMQKRWGASWKTEKWFLIRNLFIHPRIVLTTSSFTNSVTLSTRITISFSIHF